MNLLATIETETRGSHSLDRLVRCIRALGLVRGWRYWRIQNWCIKDPQLVLEWAAACESEAEAMAATHPQSAEAFRDWANKLRESHATYSANEKGQR